MPDVFLGQIMMTGFGFAPTDFAACNGALLSISQNQALFSLIGTSFGGDGRSTFALPDLRGRTPVGLGSSADADWQPLPYVLGQAGGVEAVTLLTESLPAHAHPGLGSSAGATGRNPTNSLFGTAGKPLYAAPDAQSVTLAASSVAQAGGSQPHPNLQPYETVSFAIALAGEYPSRS